MSPCTCPLFEYLRKIPVREHHIVVAEPYHPRLSCLVRHIDFGNGKFSPVSALLAIQFDHILLRSQVFLAVFVFTFTLDVIGRNLRPAAVPILGVVFAELRVIVDGQGYLGKLCLALRFVHR